MRCEGLAYQARYAVTAMDYTPFPTRDLKVTGVAVREMGTGTLGTGGVDLKVTHLAGGKDEVRHLTRIGPEHAPIHCQKWKTGEIIIKHDSACLGLRNSEICSGVNTMDIVMD